MPPINQRADSLRIYLTGAASDGAAQSDPALSLGNYRSATQAGSLGYLLTRAIPGVRIDFIAAANGTGDGTLAAVGGQLSWTAPNGSGGGMVTIANGASAILESGSAPQKFIRVARTSANELQGNATVSITDVYNDVIGQSNKETGDGKTYRLICFKAGVSVVQNLKVWIDPDTDNVRIASESPSAQPSGYFQTIADETTAPTAVSFVTPDSAVHVDALTATLHPGEMLGVWVERDVPGAATPRIESILRWSFTAVG